MQLCEIVMISAVTGVFKIFENIFVFIFVQIVTDSLSHNESSRQLPDRVVTFLCYSALITSSEAWQKHKMTFFRITFYEGSCVLS